MKPIILRRFSETIMRNKYYLTNPIVMDYFDNNVPDMEISQSRYEFHRKHLIIHCGNANCKEFKNAMKCLDAKVRR